jgi:hypothetical protein
MEVPLPDVNDDPFSVDPDDLIEDFHDTALAELLLNEADLPAGWEVTLEGSVR